MSVSGSKAVELAKRLLVDSSGGWASVNVDTAVELAGAVLEELSDGAALCIDCVSLVPRPLRDRRCESCYDYRHQQEREEDQFSPVRPGDVD